MPETQIKIILNPAQAIAIDAQAIAYSKRQIQIRLIDQNVFCPHQLSFMI